MQIQSQSPRALTAADREELSSKLGQLIASSRGLVPNLDPKTFLQTKHRSPRDLQYLTALEATARRLASKSDHDGWMRCAAAIRLLATGGWQTK